MWSNLYATNRVNSKKPEAAIPFASHPSAISTYPSNILMKAIKQNQQNEEPQESKCN